MADGNVFAPTDRMAGDSELPAEEQIKLYLAQTRPWIGVLTVLMGLSTLLMVCGGIAVQVSMSALGDALADAGPGGAFMKYIGLVYLVFAALYAVPTILLGRYTLAAGPADLHQAALAIRYQRDFWRVIGVMTVIVIALYCAGVVAMMAWMPTPAP